MRGTIFWMAPEILDNDKKGYDLKVDIWSTGCVVLEMCTGERPWFGEELYPVMFKVALLCSNIHPFLIKPSVYLSYLERDLHLQSLFTWFWTTLHVISIVNVFRGLSLFLLKTLHSTVPIQLLS